MKNFKVISRVIIGAGLMALAVACSKGSSSSSPVYPYGTGMYPNGCATCGYPGGTGSGASSVTAQFQTPFQEGVGTLNVMMQGSAGQVVVQGQMQVNQMSNYLCGLPPGMYPIQTVQPGMISGSGSISNLVFQAGPLTFQVYQAMLVNPTGGNYRFSILQGMVPCGSVTTD